MSHKNLAKVIIDPGRARFSTNERRFVRRKERARTRRMCRRLTKGEDWSEAEVYEFNTRFTDWDGIAFGDRLNPLIRYLEKQIGRPWNKTYAELKARFDERKLCNWHLMEHVRGMVVFDIETYFDRWYASYEVLYVDRNGILRMAKKGVRRAHS